MRTTLPVLTTIIVLSAAGAALAQSEAATQPINCSTAEGDLRALESEKEHARREQLRDVTAIIPAGALLGIVTGREGEKLKMLSGEYVRQINQRMAAIKQKCGV